MSSLSPRLGEAARLFQAAQLVLDDPTGTPELALRHVLAGWQRIADDEVDSATSAGQPLAAWLAESHFLPPSHRRPAAALAAGYPDPPGDHRDASRRAVRRLLRQGKEVLDRLGRAGDRHPSSRWPVRLVFAGLLLIPLAAYLASWWQATRPGRWRALYFSQPDFGGSPQLRRDRDIAFDWGEDRPLAGVPRDHFSVRWDSCLTVDEPLAARFQLISDNDSRLYIDDELIISNWQNPSTRAVGHIADLDLGTHHVVVEYCEHRGNAQVQLLASLRGEVPAPLPQAALTFPAADPLHPCSGAD